MPLPSPVPPSPETSEALLAAFPSATSSSCPVRDRLARPDRSVAVLDDGTEVPYDLFLGVPKHRAPDVVRDSGMTEEGYVPVDSRTLETAFPGVYAVGDVATVGVPKAGVFAEGAPASSPRADRAREAERRRATTGRLLLHRVRCRPRRPGRRRLPLGPEADRHLQARRPSSSPRSSTSARAAARAGSAR